MQFIVKIIKDSTGYPTDVYLWDSEKMLGDWHHPVSMNILEAESLFTALEPIIKDYRKWKKKYDKQHH